MKPPPFDYFAPQTLEEVLQLLEQYGDDAKVLAGGQSLIPTMNFRLAQPAVLIDLNGIRELADIQESDEEITVGAMTRQRMLEKSVIIREKTPLIFETIPHIAHVQIRNRGTVGGNLAHADPASELPAVMVTLNATFKLQSLKSERWVSASDFFQGMYMTALQPEEILTEVRIPVQAVTGLYGFEEVARRHGDYALAGVSVLVHLDENQNCEDVRITYFSVGEAPVPAHNAVQFLTGQPLEDEIISEAAELAANNDIDPHDDIHASAKYRRHLAKILTIRALQKAKNRNKPN
ncbi:MAG: xanthine dehydrogenase family protein subunit M [Calditrichaeota bacterium]|nr:MAG: xanthine dehydrogenase family protein subunit M [Calditrichota bacterium]